MTPDTDKREWLGEWIYAKFVQNYEKLLEENKNLRDYVDNLDSENDNQAIEIEELKKENKKLKEKVETLELWLDNKERLNEEYRDKIDLLKYQSYWPSELADSLYDANKTIEKLKEELSKYKKQYEHSMWEDDELIYEEWLYD